MKEELLEIKNEQMEKIILSRNLNEFVKYYEPKGWREGAKVHEFSACPMFHEKNIDDVKQAYENGNLEEFFEGYNNGIYNKWFFIEAVKAFFNQKDKI